MRRSITITNRAETPLRILIRVHMWKPKNHFLSTVCIFIINHSCAARRRSFPEVFAARTIIQPSPSLLCFVNCFREFFFYDSTYAKRNPVGLYGLITHHRRNGMKAPRRNPCHNISRGAPSQRPGKNLPRQTTRQVQQGHCSLRFTSASLLHVDITEGVAP